MGVETKIEWSGSSWNPWRGCDKVSPGCANCYMFTEQRRYGRDPSVVVRCADSTFYAPVRSTKWLTLPVGSYVFTCSWSDWFHEDADPWRDEAWAIIRERTDLTFQILTKRPERIAANLPDDWGDGYPNAWLGVSIENRRYVGRADLLRETPAVVRFISAEPLLGPLLYDNALQEPSTGAYNPCWFDDRLEGDAEYPRPTPELDLTGIDWLIVGGESGAGCRPFDLAWARALRDECEALGVAFFLKQLGGNPDKRGGEKARLDGRRWTEMP